MTPVSIFVSPKTKHSDLEKQEYTHDITTNHQGTFSSVGVDVDASFHTS